MSDKFYDITTIFNTLNTTISKIQDMLDNGQGDNARPKMNQDIEEYTTYIINNYNKKNIIDHNSRVCGIDEVLQQLLKFAKTHNIPYYITAEYETPSECVISSGGKKTTYEKKTVKELQQLCKKRNIKYSGLKKHEIILLLRKK